MTHSSTLEGRLRSLGLVTFHETALRDALLEAADVVASVEDAALQRAPREAGMTELEAVGVAVGVRRFVPGGHSVRLQVHESFLHLTPTEAHNLARQLDQHALDAIHADRAARHGA